MRELFAIVALTLSASAWGALCFDLHNNVTTSADWPLAFAALMLFVTAIVALGEK